MSHAYSTTPRPAAARYRYSAGKLVRQQSDMTLIETGSSTPTNTEPTTPTSTTPTTPTLSATPSTPSTPMSVPSSPQLQKMETTAETTLASPPPPPRRICPHAPEGQQYATVPSFTLESGRKLREVPVAYTTRGTLSATRDNVVVVCHALTGSADVGDWWKGMFVRDDRALDERRFFVICFNALGSPYGTASPLTPIDGVAGGPVYGAKFPQTTFADDVRLQKLVLDQLGVERIAAVVGGSMGGMLALQYAALLGEEYVRSVVAIATTAQQSAWAIGWGEAQRNMIFADPNYKRGRYSHERPPTQGLGAARMAAMMTYRSRHSFHQRFDRKRMRRCDAPNAQPTPMETTTAAAATSTTAPTTANARSRAQEMAAERRDSGTTSPVRKEESAKAELVGQVMQGVHEKLGHAGADSRRAATPTSDAGGAEDCCEDDAEAEEEDEEEAEEDEMFAVQSYLRYQARKFVDRFDANCYVHLTRKMDGHDLGALYAVTSAPPPQLAGLQEAGRLIPLPIPQPALIMGIPSDAIYGLDESCALAQALPNADLREITGEEGHDAFLIHCPQINSSLCEFFAKALPDLLA